MLRGTLRVHFSIASSFVLELLGLYFVIIYLHITTHLRRIYPQTKCYLVPIWGMGYRNGYIMGRGFYFVAEQAQGRQASKLKVTLVHNQSGHAFGRFPGEIFS